MKKTNSQTWDHLITAARKAHQPAEDVTPPFGFVTRIAALALSQRPLTLVDMLDSLSFRIGGASIILGSLLFYLGIPLSEWSSPFSEILNLNWIF